MGVVVEAVDPDLGRRVAIKRILGVSADASFQARFAREAEALAAVRHPNVVAIHERGHHEGDPFIVMDMLEGEPLDARLDRAGPLHPATAAAIVGQLARGVAHLHARGILHRDLKPANVILVAGERPVLTDFGLAGFDESASRRLTRTGEVLGTPAFMPPEQAGGEPDEIDERSDVYGLGATLFTLLTGRAPFEGKELINLINAVLMRTPPAPSALVPGVPPELDAICARCLQKERGDRYPTADALAEALEVVGTTAAPPITGRRSRTSAGALVMIALAALAAAATTTVIALDPFAAEPDVARAVPAPRPPPTPTPAAGASLDPEPPPAAVTEALPAPLAPRWRVHAPPARNGIEDGMAFDRERDVAVLVGGFDRDATEARSDVWEWAGEVIGWRYVGETPPEIPGGVASSRFAHATASHPTGPGILLYGGQPAQHGARHLAGVLWRWDGVRWEALTPADDRRSPGRRVGHAMVAAPSLGSVLLYGGGGEEANRPSALWRWIAETSRWRSARGPKVDPRRQMPGLAWDEERRRLIVYGGSVAVSGEEARPIASGHEWNGTSWTEIPNDPGPLATPRLTYVGDGLTILDGGRRNERIWCWDGQRWRELRGIEHVEPRNRAATAWDSTREQLVVFGGRAFADKADSSETWLLDRPAWDPAAPPGSERPPWRRLGPPPPRFGLEDGMAFDRGREVVVMLGGVHRDRVATDAWEWSDTGRWARAGETPPAIPRANPGSPRYAHATASHPTDGGILVYGGRLDESTQEHPGYLWHRDDGRWTAVGAIEGGPGRRYGHAMVAAPARGSVFLFGGSSLDVNGREKLWEWTASDRTWRDHEGPGVDPLRNMPGLAWDEKREVLILYGGRNAVTREKLASAFEWGGAGWRPIPDDPGPRIAPCLISDGDGSTILVGGRADAPETWRWNGRKWSVVSGVGAPNERPRRGSAWDPVRARMVLFGGVVPTTDNGIAETWLLDRAAWAR